jgi:hypothetical protein
MNTERKIQETRRQGQETKDRGQGEKTRRKTKIKIIHDTRKTKHKVKTKDNTKDSAIQKDEGKAKITCGVLVVCEVRGCPQFFFLSSPPVSLVPLCLSPVPVLFRWPTNVL